MERIHLEAMQRSFLQDINDVKPLEDADYEVLKEIGDVLRRHKCTDRFGVFLLHKHFDLADDEELVEETNAVERVSVTRAKPISAPSEDSIETMWRFKDGVQAVTKCVKRCVYYFGHPKEHLKEGY